MSLRKLLGKILILVVLDIGAMCGVPMSPEQIKRLMEVMNRTQIVQMIDREQPK